ncbi:protein of unknown function [Amycolatopsis arida]|uniref:DUF397 domain-containing protein n=1 Tax=Amycolatopsis arida TaxID=587909 RepID=A0A1I5SX45_9PSEU|nr:DUF397 domain-containing protein [Amycolatopsis arida]TDX96313.1 uncharacterized protein DUF397 [Amycolatopsis arida]SFP75355.1 protein of unknown function [Amycolatopsis arida]
MDTSDLGSVTWCKSSYSSDQANCVEVAFASGAWGKSSYSSADGPACVEVAVTEKVVGVRDSKDPGGGVLVVRAAAWRQFLVALSR